MTISIRSSLSRVILSLGIAGLAQLASGAIVVNGDFETGDFTGWNVTQAGSSVHGVYTGTGGAITPMPSAGTGSFAFSGDQQGPSHNIFTQAVTLPASFAQITLSFDFALNNTAADYFIPEPDSFDFNLDSNQQFRMDILFASASPTTVDPADIIATVYRTQSGDPLTLDWTTVTTDLTSDLLPLAGQDVILRFGAVDNLGAFGQGVDNVSLTAVPEPAVAALLMGGCVLAYLGFWRRSRS